MPHDRALFWHPDKHHGYQIPASRLDGRAMIEKQEVQFKKKKKPWVLVCIGKESRISGENIKFAYIHLSMLYLGCCTFTSSHLYSAALITPRSIVLRYCCRFSQLTAYRKTPIGHKLPLSKSRSFSTLVYCLPLVSHPCQFTTLRTSS